MCHAQCTYLHIYCSILCDTEAFFYISWRPHQLVSLDGAAPQPPAPIVVWDAPWVPSRRAEGIPLIDWGLLSKNPLERLEERKVELRQEANVGFQMLMRMGWKDSVRGPPPPSAPAVVWKEDRKGLMGRSANRATQQEGSPPPPCPPPRGPVAQQLYKDDPATYQALWGKYCLNWQRTGECS
eukprot:GGOE01001035.1.p1 GENE.GGOE01001035.1~~GGOE01001035.1.p1  ORF type:complete len:203 (+),score=10.56 GGOE01001035.1:65-610(+)